MCVYVCVCVCVCVRASARVCVCVCVVCVGAHARTCTTRERYMTPSRAHFIHFPSLGLYPLGLRRGQTTDLKITG